MTKRRKKQQNTLAVLKTENEKPKPRKALRFKRVLEIAAALFWIFIIVGIVRYRDRLTVDGIVNMTPQHTAPAIALFLLLFALKSITIVIYCGLLYAAGGIVFPIPIALSVNLTGTAIMVTIPYFIGKVLGEETAEKLVRKYPKLNSIYDLRRNNDVYFSFLVRIVGLFPSDPLSAYMGASGTAYPKYLLGSLLGMLPGMIVYTLLGMSVKEIGSPVFWISVISAFLISVISLAVFLLKRQRASNEINNGK